MAEPNPDSNAGVALDGNGLAELSNGDIVVRIPRAEALVMFDYLSRAWERRSMAFEDKAEQKVIWHLEGMLARVLVEPFRPDYRELVRRARDELSDNIDQGRMIPY